MNLLKLPNLSRSIFLRLIIFSIKVVIISVSNKTSKPTQAIKSAIDKLLIP